MNVRYWAACGGMALATIPGAWWAASAAGQTPPSADQGERLFRTHCATCHGTAGRGDGPMVQYLRVPPADLTRLAARNRGVFPAEAMHRIIDGRQAIRSHGDSTMPIWGDAFASSGGDARERIRALVLYLETMQARAGEE